MSLLPYTTVQLTLQQHPLAEVYLTLVATPAFGFPVSEQAWVRTGF